MPPRKGAARADAASTRSMRSEKSTTQRSVASGYKSDGSNIALRTPIKGTHTVQRQIYSPASNGRYTRGQVDVPVTPRRTRPAAVARTPYSVQRTIGTYSAEQDPIKTYLRLKPADAAILHGGAPMPKSTLQVVSDKAVELAGDGVRERYLFAGVLPAMTQQDRVFEVCGMPVVRDLFRGYNTLLFSYGVTNSGKTHTVTGSADDPGVLPRSVAAILDVLDRQGAQGDFAVRPKYATQVEFCSDPRVTAPTFRVAPGEDRWVDGLHRRSDDVDAAVKMISDELAADGGREWVYQLYVSYFEIYNEMVYDLLDLSTLTTVQVAESKQPRGRGRPRGRKRQQQAAVADDPLAMSATQIGALPRTALLVRTEGGRSNEPFVDGVTAVRVRGVRDLARVLVHGQLRRSVHATGLNAGSSRSHALLQARLVKIRRSAVVGPATTPATASSSVLVGQASVRGLTVVDLAGSERAKRTLAQGERLAEAGKINTSLMTLKKCMDVKRFNAGLGPSEAPTLVPYNESKVTRLLQPALEGGAKTVMVVCVDPYETKENIAAAGNLHAETKGVLDFARVASELVTCVRRVEDPLAEEMPPDAGEVGSDGELFSGKKRAGSPMSVDGNGDEDKDHGEPMATTKRVRTGLGGAWREPPSSASAATASLSERPGRSITVPSSSSQRRRIPPAASIPSGVWRTITENSPFTFTLTPEQVQREAPVLLSRALELNTDHRREIDTLQRQLRDVTALVRALEAEHGADTGELVQYAMALQSAVEGLRKQCAVAQERSVRIEAETRRDAGAFFMARLEEVKAQSRARLLEEIQRGEAKAAHKLDILSRLRVPPMPDTEGEAAALEAVIGETDAAKEPTVSPRTAVRRAVSRAASKKANKVTSVSAGESTEIVNLRAMVELLEAQNSSQLAQLDLATQARAADREAHAALEQSLAEAQARVARATQMESRAVSGKEARALSQAHAQERAEFIAQVTMLKAQLREAEVHAARARRQWETHELLPVQERLRKITAARNAASDASPGELLERAERDRDDAWAWWTREQERNSQLCAQNDVLMREIRHLRAQARGAELEAELGDAYGGQHRVPTTGLETQVRESTPTDSEDGSFCKVSLKSINSIEAINGGNPIGVSSLAVMSQSSVAADSAALARMASSSKKKGRALRRNNITSMESVANASTSMSVLSSPISSKHTRFEQKAKRVVSRVFHHLTPESRRNRADSASAATRPYLAPRFAATTDMAAAVGNYSAEVLSFEGGRYPGGLRALDDGQQLPLASMSAADLRAPKVRSVVYSGPIVAHPTGGVSVTFTSQEVHDLPIDATVAGDDANHMDGDQEDDGEDHAPVERLRRESSPQGTKRTRAMLKKMAARTALQKKSDAENANNDDHDDDAEMEDQEPAIAANDDEYMPSNDADADHPRQRVITRSQRTNSHLSSSSKAPSKNSAASMKSRASSGKKKRKLHKGRTIMNVGPENSDYEEDAIVGTPRPHRVATPLSKPPAAAAAGRPLPARLATPAAPEENKQPVLYTPIRARSRSGARQSMDHLPQTTPSTMQHEGDDDKNDSFFLTPMKMLSRLRNKKK